MRGSERVGRRVAGRLLALAAVVAALGCAPAVDTTMLGGPYPPRPPDEEILTYSTRLPECPYAEVAVLAGFESDLTRSLDDTLDALKAEARRLGADAIVNLQRIERGGESRRSGYTGTADSFHRRGVPAVTPSLETRARPFVRLEPRVLPTRSEGRPWLEGSRRGSAHRCAERC